MTESQALSIWWWGEDEAPGLGAWLEQACNAFEKASPGLTVTRRLLRHDQVLPGFPEAARAGTAPDVHFFWNGIYVIENAWRGDLAALDDLLSAGELEAFGGGPQSRFRGKTYRAAWYVIPVVWVANREVLARARVTALPESWAELIDACEAVRLNGDQALTVGDGEGDFSVWWLTHYLTQHLDVAADVFRLVLAELDWREPRYHTHWSSLAVMKQRGYLDSEALPLSLWDGLKQFNRGHSAFTLASGPMFADCRRALGENATVMVAPRLGSAAMSGRAIVDTQGWGIWGRSPRKRAAASFLSFLNKHEWRSRLWEEVRLFPADRRWAGPGADPDPDYRRMWDWYSTGSSVLYVPNLMPLDLHYRLAADIGQAVLAGRCGGRQAGQLARARCEEWRRADAGRIALYRDWAADIAREPANGGVTA